MGRHGGFPTGRPWDFAPVTCTLAGTRGLPDPFLGSGALRRTVTGRLLRPGSGAPLKWGALLPRLRRATGGDSNPDCPCRVSYAAEVRVALSLAADSPPCPLFVASHGLRRVLRLLARRNRAPLPKPFPISPVSFLPDDTREFTFDAPLRQKYSTTARPVIHRASQPHKRHSLARCISRWTT